MCSCLDTPPPTGGFQIKTHALDPRSAPTPCKGVSSLNTCSLSLSVCVRSLSLSLCHRDALIRPPCALRQVTVVASACIKASQPAGRAERFYHAERARARISIANEHRREPTKHWQRHVERTVRRQSLRERCRVRIFPATRSRVRPVPVGGHRDNATYQRQ